MISSIFKEYHPELISFLGIKGMKMSNSSIKDSAILCRKRKK